jgi:hypothetical protein
MIQFKLHCRLAVVLALACLPAFAADDDKKQVWNFDDDKPGDVAKGFKGYVGKWVVAKSAEGQALAQTATNPNSTFNIALIADTSATDVDISVKMKAIAGEIDQGGGIVWRAQDDKNYYLARYNPLEDNYRLYKVIGGKRTLLQNADITHSDGWHTLRITMKGDSITCFYDDKKYLEHKDDALPKAGMIGLWSKADAQSQFDALSLSKAK